MDNDIHIVITTQRPYFSHKVYSNSDLKVNFQIYLRLQLLSFQSELRENYSGLHNLV